MDRSRDRTVDTRLLGRQVRFAYAPRWVVWAVLGARLLMGWIFLQAGLAKLLESGLAGLFENPATGGWTAAEYLRFGTTESPLHESFLWLIDYTWVLDPLVVWGQVLIGLALLLGVLLRPAAVLGAVQMLAFWLAGLQGGLGAGLPVEHGFVVDATLVSALVLLGLAAVGAGRLLGVDARLARSEVVRAHPWLASLLG